MGYLELVSPATPAGGQTVRTGSVLTYDDVKAQINRALKLANEKLTSPSRYSTSYAQHVLDALATAGTSVRRAVAMTAFGLRGTLSDSSIANIKAIENLVIIADKSLAPYRAAVAQAVLMRQGSVDLPVFAQAVSDSGGAFGGVLAESLLIGGMPAEHNFRDNVIWYLGVLRDAIAGLVGWQAAAKLLGDGGLLDFVGQAFTLVGDVLAGLWGFAQGLASVFKSLGDLGTVVVWGGVAYGGYWGAKKLGVIA